MRNRAYNKPVRNLTITEGPRALAEIASLFASAPFLSQSPRGDGHPVLVMPGFGAGDRSTRVIRRFLSALNYSAQPWKLGTNLGPMMADLPTKLAKRLDEVFIEGEQKVSLVGWSMGGVYARMLAQLYPGKVRQVITLGSPFSTSRTTSSYRTVAKVRSLSIEQIPAPDLRLLASEPLDSVPSTAIFSKSDGVVSWQIASQQPSDIAENIEVYTSHLGLGFSPAVLYALADRLKHPTDNWQKFKRTGWKRFVYGPANLSSPQGRAKTRSNTTA